MYEGINPKIIASIRRYADEHVAPGGFLVAVLSNSLSGAVFTADDDNLNVLPEIVRYCYNEIPGDCWGSLDIVRQWVAAREVKP